ncbi:conserved hypothetical protein [Coccidioides posadasii str. Silveira]|uniref:Uncharacterized protein n=1 Tax=Coccidioides posadasii (strain RMSCC 757 / Silveira) TaxID=443226 RepID=E9DF63_COCPS|nr:conserved hypothetical protein [Coccidioides posadasii str. Silveira]
MPHAWGSRGRYTHCAPVDHDPVRAFAYLEPTENHGPRSSSVIRVARVVVQDVRPHAARSQVSTVHGSWRLWSFVFACRGAQIAWHAGSSLLVQDTSICAL